MKFGLSNENLNEIVQIISAFDAIEKAVLFGSRAKGKFKPGSDIDIAIYGDKINFHVVSKLHAQLEDNSKMPYLFDIVDGTHLTNLELRNHIEQVGQIIFSKSAPKL